MASGEKAAVSVPAAVVTELLLERDAPSSSSPGSSGAGPGGGSAGGEPPPAPRGAQSVLLPAGLLHPSSVPIRNIRMKFAVLIGLIQVGEVSNRDIVETVLNLVRTGQVGCSREVQEDSLWWSISDNWLAHIGQQVPLLQHHVPRYKCTAPETGPGQSRYQGYATTLLPDFSNACRWKANCITGQVIMHTRDAG
ncbi:hypothetical protein NDU88_002448 [Pleurodeles waltl]|uniref:Uncharacterized protein n=1 Tax=Pleurodeles waltl TaxID=8319 RepID=A0AAV7NFG4_PLEWA|nr:hypothetical protein NDU88_002448 [Pleurodeles waltl]